MDRIINNLSTRELAWAIWILVGLIACFFSSSIRQSLLGILKALFAWKIILSLIVFFLHTALYVFILYKFDFWDISLIKDTLIWGLGFGVVSLFSINKVKDNQYFRTIFFETIKWTLVIEFILNFFTFSLTLELIIVPFIVFLAMIQAYTSLKPEHKQVEIISRNILMFFGSLVALFSLYKTIELYDQVFTINNSKSFLLPIILSITFLPFMYLYNLLVKYEVLWVRLDFSIRNNLDRKRVKRQIFWIANFNINKLVSISNNISKPINGYNDLSYEMIKSISKREYIGSDELKDELNTNSSKKNILKNR